MIQLASVVDVNQLLEAIVASIVAAITVTIVVCFAIWGAVKYADFNQAGRGGAAAGALTVSIFGLAATFGIIAFTIYLMVAAPK